MSFRIRLVQVLEEFHRCLLAPLLTGVKARLEKIRRTHQRILEENPRRFLNQLTLDNYSSFFGASERIRIALCAFDERSVHLFLRPAAAILYGPVASRRLTEEGVSEKTDRSLKALGDPKRLEILRLLRYEQGQRNRILYSFNEEGFREMLSALEKEFLD